MKKQELLINKANPEIVYYENHKFFSPFFTEDILPVRGMFGR